MRSFRIIVLGFIVLSTSLLAQPFPPSPEGGPGFKSQLREKISIIRMWKLIDVLELGEEQAMVFFPALNQHDADIEKLNQDENRLLDELELDLTNGIANDKRLQARIDSVIDLRTERSQIDAEFFQKIADILNAEQRAKFLLFDRKFDKEMRKAIDMGVRGDRPMPMRDPSNHR